MSEHFESGCGGNRGTLPTPKPKTEYKYTCPAGNYTSNSIVGLMWAIFTHRMWHLVSHGKWMD